MENNIVLIGMPGSGKSTVGVLLAKQSCRSFVDTDVEIQVAAGQSLQQLVDEQGYLALRRVEAQVICGLAVENHVISTGGSAVYSANAMAHLRQMGPIVYLSVAIETLERRIHDYSQRGLAGPAGQTLAELYAERKPLYEKYADIVVVADTMNADDVAQEVISRL